MKQLMLLAAALPVIAGCFREPVAAPPGLTRDDVVAIIREERAGVESALAERLAALDITLKGINVTLVGFNERIEGFEDRLVAVESLPEIEIPEIPEVAGPDVTPKIDDLPLTIEERASLSDSIALLLEHGITNDQSLINKDLLFSSEVRASVFPLLLKLVSEGKVSEELQEARKILGLSDRDLLLLWSGSKRDMRILLSRADRIATAETLTPREIEAYRSDYFLRPLVVKRLNESKP